MPINVPNKPKTRPSDLTRRRFIVNGALAGITLTLPQPIRAAVMAHRQVDRIISLHNTHTRESLRTVYWADGVYSQEALQSVSHILRDHRSGEVKPIDRHLLDLLYAIEKRLGVPRTFHVISGYRSPATNARLRERSKGIAKNSLHMYGKAIDIRLSDGDLLELRRAARALGVGGVGYYPRSGFVHVDVGRVRYWEGRC
jgi:uncharacterized protein YcbK (DUF882 family)